MYESSSRSPRATAAGTIDVNTISEKGGDVTLKKADSNETAAATKVEGKNNSREGVFGDEDLDMAVHRYFEEEERQRRVRNE